MRDFDLRQKLLATLLEEHAHDASTRVVQEMGIWSGTVRVDVAVINGEIQGYELKSDRDTLSRLPQQAELYSQVFDRATLVVGPKHIASALQLIPSWWGVISATMHGQDVALQVERESQVNEGRNLKRLVGLLWRSEMVGVLEKRALLRGYKSKTIDVLQDRIIASMTEIDLAREVREALKSRVGWLR